MDMMKTNTKSKNTLTRSTFNTDMDKHTEGVIIRDAPPQKNGKMWEFFPSGGPPPLPPVWEPHVCEKN